MPCFYPDMHFLFKGVRCIVRRMPKGLKVSETMPHSFSRFSQQSTVSPFGAILTLFQLQRYNMNIAVFEFFRDFFSFFFFFFQRGQECVMSVMCHECH